MSKPELRVFAGHKSCQNLFAIHIFTTVSQHHARIMKYHQIEPTYYEGPGTHYVMYIMDDVGKWLDDFVACPRTLRML